MPRAVKMSGLTNSWDPDRRVDGQDKKYSVPRRATIEPLTKTEMHRIGA
jgi:hypothetical protein